MSENCKICGRSLDESSMSCQNFKHTPSGPEESFVEDIQADINGRSGIGWDGLDEETQMDIRNSLRKIVRGAVNFLR